VAVDWYPLALGTPVVVQHLFGGRAILDRLGRAVLLKGCVAETWECSDVDGRGWVVQDGLLAGQSLRALVERHSDELVCRGWRGPHFSVLTKFIEGADMLAHTPACWRRGRAPPGGAAQRNDRGVIHPGRSARRHCVGRSHARSRPEQGTRRLQREDFDAVMRRLSVRAGETVYVLGGTLHSFGPNTLIYEIEQTSDIRQHVMTLTMGDGSPLPAGEWQRSIDKLLEELRPEPQPQLRPSATASTTPHSRAASALR
jgi:mannose-6-phosphate isomerase